MEEKLYDAIKNLFHQSEEEPTFVDNSTYEKIQKGFENN